MGKHTGVCRYCGNIRPFAKSHVISKTLFKELFKKHKRVHFLNVKDIEGSNLVQDAFYDTHILCSLCDTAFSPLEDYFTKFVKGELVLAGITERVSRTDYGEFMVDTYRPIDTIKLRLFYLLTLWRSSISVLDTFNSVNLGNDEELISDWIKNGNPGDYNDYGVILISFAEVDDIRALSAIGPANATVEGFPITVVLFNQWAIVFSRKKHNDQWLFPFALKDTKELQVVVWKEKEGVQFLNRLTHLNVHIKKGDVKGLS